MHLHYLLPWASLLWHPHKKLTLNSIVADQASRFQLATVLAAVLDPDSVASTKASIAHLESTLVIHRSGHPTDTAAADPTMAVDRIMEAVATVEAVAAGSQPRKL